MGFITGNDSSEVINGTPVTDVIDGRGGDDTIDGRSGNDYILGESGKDNLEGGDGNDRIIGGFGGDIVNDEDILKGGSGNDSLYGGSGFDQLLGGPGDDFLLGAGSFSDDEIDVLTGGSGNDTFVLGQKGFFFYIDPLSSGGFNRYAAITDFEIGDKVQLTGDIRDYRFTGASATDGISVYTGVGLGSDLIAIVEGQTGGNLSEIFEFLG